MPKRNEFATESEWLEHLRIYFAAKAMGGELASQSQETGEYTDKMSDEGYLSCAKRFYRMADAMLKAREAKQ